MVKTPILSNTEAERLVLGCVIQDGGLMDAVRGALEVDDFGLQTHQKLWRAVCAVYDAGKSLDRISVYTQLRETGEPESAGWLSLLADLGEGTPMMPNLDTHISAIKDKTILRRALALAENISTRCLSGSGTAQEIRESLAAGVVDLSATSEEHRPISTREMIEVQGIDALLKPRRTEGIRLPWVKMNDALCGLHPGQVIICGAATGRGKTSFALQIAAHATRQGKSPMIWTLEMSPRQNFVRMVNQLAHSDSDAVRHGALSPEHRQARKDAAFWLHGHPVWFDKHSRTVPSFVASVRQAKAKSDVGLVIVDYLQLIRFAGRAESRTREVGENSRALKLAAMDLDLPFLVLSQFKRLNDTRDYTIHDFKECGDIENDADVALIMNGPKLDGDMNIPVRVNIGKQREGPTGCDIDLVFNPPSQSFSSAEDL